MTPVLKPHLPAKKFTEKPIDPMEFGPKQPFKPFQSLTPNPKRDQQKLEVDFKGLQNYVLSNMGSSD